MSERLLIRDFAGIKEIDITLSRINLLIGPQATGKSICAKLLYYFKSFLGDVLKAVESQQTKRQFDTAFIQKFQRYFPPQDLDNKDFLLRYEISDCFIQIEQERSKLRLTYSDYYKNQLVSWRKYYKQDLEETGDAEVMVDYGEVMLNLGHSFYFNQKEELEEVSAFSQVFIPAGRSFFAILQSSIFSFLSSNNAIDPFLIEFGSFYEKVKLSRSRTVQSADDQKLANKIAILVESILGGKHVREKGQDYLLLSDGRKVSLANSSSGQQEMLPLALILGSISFNRPLFTLGNVVYIEEPEAHLFPSAQRKIVDLIALIHNEAKIPTQFVITTHSPYILTALNNLIYAGHISTQLSDGEMSRLEDIVPQERFLKTADIRVYSLHNGISESIISDETGMITTSTIDEVSDELATQFDSILSLE